MAMTEEEINALNEQIVILTQNISVMNETIQTFNKFGNKNPFDDFFKSADKTGDSVNDLRNSIDSSSTAINNLRKNTEDITEEMVESNKFLSSAIKSTTTAVGSFADALISNEKGFLKYNNTLDHLGQGVSSVTSMFGPFGKILGGIVQGGVLVAKQMTAQADATLQARDQLYAIGGAGEFTAEEVRQMGINAGLSSSNLELLIKPLKSLGPALMSFGGTAGQGAEAFARLTAVTSEQRMEMNRLGVGQEELLQTQADYIKLQQMSGTQISSRFKTEAQLQKESLAYVANLRELAAITGEDVETIKQRQREAANEAELQIRTFQLQERANKLREDGNETEAAAIEAQLAAEKALMETVSSVGDPAMTAAFTEFIATGGNIASEAGAKLSLLGVDLEGVRERLQSGDLEAGNFALQEYTEGVRDTIRGPLGDAARYSEEMRNTFGLTPKIISTAISTAGIDIEEAGDAAAARIADAQTQSYDAAASARAALTEVEITAKTELDNFVASINPLMGKFGDLTDIIGSFNEKLKWFIDKLKDSGDILKNIAMLIAAKAGVNIVSAGVSMASRAARTVVAGATALGGVLGMGSSAANTTSAANTRMNPAQQAQYQSLRAQNVPASEALQQARNIPDSGANRGSLSSTASRTSSKWDDFIKFVSRKSPRLLARLGPRLAAMAGMAAIPGPGWVAALVNLGLNLGLCWELYNLWKEFSGSGDTETETDTTTQESIPSVPLSESEQENVELMNGGTPVEVTETPLATETPVEVTETPIAVTETEIPIAYSASNRQQLIDTNDSLLNRDRETALLRESSTAIQTPGSDFIASEPTEQTINNSITEASVSTRENLTTTEKVLVLNEQLMSMISHKLDIVIEKLGDSVDIQDRSFRYNSV